VVANHGGTLPVDGAILGLDLLRRTDPTRVPRAIAAHFLPQLPVVGTLLARLGVVVGTPANVRRLLDAGDPDRLDEFIGVARKRGEELERREKLLKSANETVLKREADISRRDAEIVELKARLMPLEPSA
jgi:hypothetical protein